MFIEASNLPKGYLAKMTKKILLTGKSCLSFYYNMYGVYMGSIKVLVQGKQVFEVSGDKGKGWKKAEVKLQGTGVTEVSLETRNEKLIEERIKFKFHQVFLAVFFQLILKIIYQKLSYTDIGLSLMSLSNIPLA